MLKEGERLDDLFRESMQIIQSRGVFSFSVDALLLANFTRIVKRDRKIIDLCSGNGVIPLLLSHRTIKPIEAVELQPQCSEIPEGSLSLNDKADQITLHPGDIRQIRERFSHPSVAVVTVIPPYFTNNQPLKTLG